MNTPSERSTDFLITEEVTSQAYYERHYQHPEWPGGASGITIAVGYDLGYATAAKIRLDWSHLVSADMLEVMVSCAGITGEHARLLLPRVKASIVIPWAAAIEVFKTRDVPAWSATVARDLPNTDQLSGTCFGVLVGLAYNRGAGGFDAAGDRYTEMRAIKADMAERAFSAVPSSLRSMVRLWPTVAGLRARREAEAKLWESGMAEAANVAPAAPATPANHTPDPDMPMNAGPARTKPPATTPAQHLTFTALLTWFSTLAGHASTSGASKAVVASIAIGGFAFAVAVWVVWYRNRNPK